MSSLSFTQRADFRFVKKKKKKRRITLLIPLGDSAAGVLNTMLFIKILVYIYSYLSLCWYVSSANMPFNNACITHKRLRVDLSYVAV